MPEARILRSALEDSMKSGCTLRGTSVKAAEKLVNSIEAAASRLARMPGIGRERDELQPGLLSYPLGNYVLFYRRTQFGIDLLHVYHGARRIEELFKQNRE